VKKIKNKGKTKAELLKELEILREEQEKGVFKDIAEDKQAAQENENRFRELFNRMSSGVIIYEAKGNGRDFIIKNINPAVEKIEKIKKEDILGKSVLKVFPAVKDFGLFKVFQEVFKTGRLQHHPISLYQDQRITGWRENYVYKLPSGEIVALYDDITEHKKLEEVLRAGHQRLHNVLEVMPVMVCLLTPDYHVAFANRAFREKFGESHGRHCYEYCFGKKEPCDFCESYEVLKTGKPHRWEVTSPDGATVIDAYDYPFTDIDSSPMILEIDVDITEHKKAIEKTKHLNLILRAIRKVNQLITKETDPEVLIQKACNMLVETRGYFRAWIVLLDEKGKIENYSGTGPGQIFLPIVKQLKPNHFPACGKKALTQQDLVIIKDPATTCTDCSLASKYANCGAMVIRLEHKGKIYGFLSVSVPFSFIDLEEEKDLFKEVADDIALALYSIKIEKRNKQVEEKIQKATNATIEAMSRIIDTRDPYTTGHQRRVTQLSIRIAQELKLSKERTEGIRIASLLHDIGKLGIPAEILAKPSRLSDIELSLIKSHSQLAYDILKDIDFSYPVAQIVLQHHERLNGSGYPQGLKGDDILLEAKIIAVADVVEAMSSFRPYRTALGIDAALEEISRNKGILYDSEVVDVCWKLFKEKDFKF